jgi:hypothetical protein
MKNKVKTISFEHENEETYYVVQAPDLRFSTIKDDAVIFDEYDDLMAALKCMKYISFPWPKMVINDL